MNEILLEVAKVRKVFTTVSENLEVLKDITFSAPAGSIVVITGQSGCGKSTLLHLIGGLEAVTGGVIRVGEMEVSKMGERDLTLYRRKTLGFIFQLHLLLKEFTALENVAIPALIDGVPKTEAFQKAAHLLNQVGLSGRLKHFPPELSGGERQRVAVARALINDPLLILADEPTGNLDEGNARVVQEQLFSLAREYRKTVVLVTHDRELAREGDQRFLLHEGVLHPL